MPIAVSKAQFFTIRAPIKFTVPRVTAAAPTIDVDLTTGSLPSGVSLTRASANGTYFDNAGVLQTAAADYARFTYRYNGSAWVISGLLVEPERTNLALDSANFAIGSSQWNVSGVTVNATALTAPDGTATGARMTENTATSEHEIYQHILHPAATQLALSSYMQAGTQANLVATQYGTTNNWLGLVAGMTGVSIGETAVGAASGTIDASGIVRAGASWRRAWLVGQQARANPYMVLALASAASGNIFDIDGQVIYLGASKTGGVWGVQAEAGSLPSSLIITGNAIATRTADNLLIGWPLLPDGTYTITLTRDNNGSDDVTTLTSQVVQGGYLVPTSTYPLKTVSFLLTAPYTGPPQYSLASDAYSASGLNMVCILKTQSTTYNNNQYIIYYNTSRALRIAKRSLTTGIITVYNPGLAVADDDDEHRVPSLGIDASGYIHLSYNMHNDPLRYYKSNSPEDPSAFTVASMVGTNETSVSYPMFIKDAGVLYFTFRSGGSGDGDQFFYTYNGSTWAAASGTGTGGIVILGRTGSPRHSAYLNGLPKFHTNGHLWWSFTLLEAGTAGGKNQYWLEWTGSAFKKHDGTAQTIPATVSNLTAAVTINPDKIMLVHCDSAISAAGILYATYARLDAAAPSGRLQVYVLENSTASFVERVLTTNADATIYFPPGTAPYDGNTPAGWTPSMFIKGSNVYVAYPDVFTGGLTGTGAQGLVSHVSTNHFVSNVRAIPFAGYNPNMGLNYDVQRLATGIVSFAFMHTSDPQYGVTDPYASPLIKIIDWTPA